MNGAIYNDVDVVSAFAASSQAFATVKTRGESGIEALKARKELQKHYQQDSTFSEVTDEQLKVFGGRLISTLENPYVAKSKMRSSQSSLDAAEMNLYHPRWWIKQSKIR